MDTSAQVTVIWKFVGVIEERGSCEMCGHEIRWAYIVTSSDGAMRKVGSDCIWHFVTGDERTKAERAVKRYERAKREWNTWQKFVNGDLATRRELRGKAPRAKHGETRSEYIERRVKEMANAKKGFALALSVFDRRGGATLGWGKRFRQMISDGEITVPEVRDYRDEGYFDYQRIVSFYETIYYNNIRAEIEAKTGSNRFDWSNRKHSYINNI